jgi:hypothetical protein
MTWFHIHTSGPSDTIKFGTITDHKRKLLVEKRKFSVCIQALAAVQIPKKSRCTANANESSVMASVTVPVQIPVFAINVEEAPPMTTSSKGAMVNAFSFCTSTTQHLVDDLQLRFTSEKW